MRLAENGSEQQELNNNNLTITIELRKKSYRKTMRTRASLHPENDWQAR